MPTRIRRSSTGSADRPPPISATAAARATRATPTPVKAERQLRVDPTASTIVSASTHSTALARNTEAAVPRSAPLIAMNLASPVAPPRHARPDAIETPYGLRSESPQAQTVDRRGHGPYRGDGPSGHRGAGALA